MSNMILATFALYSLIASTSAGFPAIPIPIGKTVPKAPQPRPEVQPKGNPKPNNNKPQNLPPTNPGPEQARAKVNNVIGLNNALKRANDVADLINIGYNIASAILETTQSTTAIGERSH